MGIQISGVNNNDKITATDGTIDLLSSANLTGILTAPAFNASGNITAASINAGVATATTFVGNLTGNVNHTSNLLLQISGSEKLRIANSGAFGLNGTNYGTSGQVLTSQGSGSSPTWSTISVGGDTGIDFNNNVKIRFGTASDKLEIYHSGTGAAILNSNTSTQLTIASDNALNLTSRTGTEYYFRAYPNSRSELYFDYSTYNTPKLQTSATGVTVNGTVTATSFSGDGSALTGTGVGSNTSINTTGIITATSFSGSGANLTGLSTPLSFRNIAINGAMNINQRQTTSSTASNGYRTIDRWSQDHGSTDEAPTFQQFDVSPPSSPYHLPTSGDHPYREGFRKAWGVTNGNQTSGAGADDNIIMGYAFEAQDIANSGWDYTNPNSDITLSFWIKSSVSQEFFGQLLTMDGTLYNYPFGTGVLTAFTWTKVVKTIPGNANLTFDNDNGPGLRFYLWPFAGTNLTGNITNDAWMVNNYSTRVANNTTTWYTTNDASLQITGFQLEVGSSATTFEHRGHSEELARCERYYQRYGAGRQQWMTNVNGTDHRKMVYFPTTMRAAPSMNLYDQSVDGSSVSAQGVTPNGYYCKLNGNGRHASWKHEANAEI